MIKIINNINSLVSNWEKILLANRNTNTLKTNLIFINEEFCNMQKESHLYKNRGTKLEWILMDYDTFYKAFFIGHEIIPSPPRVTKPLVVNYITNCSELTKNSVLDSLRDLGFSDYAVNFRMTKNIKKTNEHFSDEMNTKYLIRNSKKEDLLQLKVLWSLLDPYGFDQTKGDLISAISNGEFLVAETNEDIKKIVASLWIHKTGSTYQLDHIVTDREYRRNKLAYKLINRAFSLIGHGRVNLWINRENSAALNLYNGFGFKQSRTASFQMIKNHI